MQSGVGSGVDLALCAALLACASCAATGGDSGASPGTETPAAIAIRAQLRERLDSELARFASVGETLGLVPDYADCVHDLRILTVQPQDGGNAPADYQFRLAVRLPGDGDGNGEVSIDDLTPLGNHFLEPCIDANSAYNITSPLMYSELPYPSGIGNHGQWEKFLIDGDNNAELNLADVTPIARHFGQQFDAFRVWRKAGDGEWTLLGAPGLPAGIAMIRAGAQAQYTGGWNRDLPLVYSFDDTTAPLGELYYRIEPYSQQAGAAGAAGYSIAAYNGSMTVRPFIYLSAPPEAEPGMMVQAQVQAGYSGAGAGSPLDDPGASLWLDYEGDGEYDEQLGLAAQSFSHSFSEEGDYNLRARLRASNGEAAFADWRVKVYVNDPPVARLKVSLSDEFAPANATLDSTGTYDPDGDRAPLQTWELIGPDGKAVQNSGYFRCALPGHYVASLTASDALGLSDTATVEFDLEQGGEQSPDWQIQPLVQYPPALYGTYCPLDCENIAGQPAIAYLSQTSETEGRLYYLPATDAQGTGWSAAIPAQSGNLSGIPDQMWLGYGVQLFDCGGRPGLGVQLATVSLPLSFAGLDYWTFATSAAADAWSEPHYFPIHHMGLTGGFSQTGGNPAYYTRGNPNFTGELYLSQDGSGAAWPDSATELPAINAGHLVDIGGRPAVIGGRGSSEPVLISRALDSLGSAWEEPASIPVLNGASVLHTFDCAGRPALLCLGPDSRVLLAVATNAQVSGWTVNEVPPASPLISYSTLVSCAALQGRPAIAWVDYQTASLLFITALDATGAAWSDLTVVDSRGAIEHSLALIDAGGKAAIAYPVTMAHSDGTADHELRFARRR